QAEDGIRDYKVTGVQTCALPISLHRLDENRLVEIQASEAYERWQAERRAGRVPGPRLGMPPKPYAPPPVPDGVMNKTDPDSRMKIGRASCRERVEGSDGAGTAKK